MFQTSESCIKLHAVAVLELLLSEQCPLLQVCVCVCVCVSTAPSVCVLGWVKYREHISLPVILCIIVYVTNNFFFSFSFLTDNGKMLKYRETDISVDLYK